MKKKHFFTFCVATALLLGIGVANAAGSWTSGSTTVVLTGDGVLTVTGTGAMQDYPFDVNQPWYASRYAIKTLVIKEGVTRIGDRAFSDCSYLTCALIIPNSVTSIGEGAFWFCSGLTGALTIPDSVTSIGNYAFAYCYGLTGALTIPNRVTSIGHFAFAYCSGLTGALTIPDSVTSIGGNAFYHCSGLTGALTIPNSVTSIGNSAFSGCIGLTAINVDAANTKYSSVDGVLYNKNQNTLVMCPAGKSGALTIPNSVTNIGEAAFSGCSGLTSVTIPDGVTSIGNSAFSGCSGLTSVTIPDGVTSIGNSAFSGCNGLTGALTIPNSLASIGYYAFFGCIGLTGALTIPNSVTSIGEGAFQGCIGLTSSVFCLAAKPPTLYGKFTAASTLYVPESALDAYKTNSDWSSAFDIILAIESATSIKTVDTDKVHVYPNPTTGVVYVDNANGAEVKVYNLSGVLLHRTRESRVDLSGEPSGVYLLRVEGETLKVVKK